MIFHRFFFSLDFYFAHFIFVFKQFENDALFFFFVTQNLFRCCVSHRRRSVWPHVYIVLSYISACDDDFVAAGCCYYSFSMESNKKHLSFKTHFWCLKCNHVYILPLFHFKNRTQNDSHRVLLCVCGFFFSENFTLKHLMSNDRKKSYEQTTQRMSK